MKILVIGAGKSGLAAALLAKRKGNDVFLTEAKLADACKDTIKKLEAAAIEYEFGENSDKGLIDCQLVITSPGVPPTVEIIKKAESLRIPIISEVEYAAQFLDNPIVAITGTNGKTTTTTLLTHILNNGGRNAVAAGNIGRPLSELVDNISPETVIVAELSSFQLDRIAAFKPQVAVILNISPDHLYYHDTMENYINAKFKISLQQSAENLLILNGEDSAVLQIVSKTEAKIAYFGMKPLAWGIYVDGGIIKFKTQHKTEDLMLLSELSLPGIHNAQNSMAAAMAARAFEISNENIRDSLMSFRGVEHRLEFVRTFNGIDFINDSKATNVNATWYALSSYTKPIIWIAGGRGDNNDYSQLDKLVDENVKTIICFGEEKDEIFNHFCLMKRCIKAETLEEAVTLATENADFDEVVLFTPACKSFDMFMNFEHRGEEFKRIVAAIG